MARLALFGAAADEPCFLEFMGVAFCALLFIAVFIGIIFAIVAMLDSGTPPPTDIQKIEQQIVEKRLELAKLEDAAEGLRHTGT